MANPAPQRDNNGYPSWAGVSCVDGVTLIPIQFDSVTNAMKIDTVTVISFTPVHKNSGGQTPFVHGVSTANSKVTFPFYVNPATGAVLADMT